jgi:hypothetical protein
MKSNENKDKKQDKKKQAEGKPRDMTNKEGARRFEKKTREYAEDGEAVEEAAKEARRAVSEEGHELAEAENKAKKRAQKPLARK